jgi:hypothetical protein
LEPDHAAGRATIEGTGAEAAWTTTSCSRRNRRRRVNLTGIGSGSTTGSLAALGAIIIKLLYE